MYKKKGDLDTALLQYLKELEMRAAVFGGYAHSDIGFSCQEIGDVYFGDVYDLQGNTAAAIEMYAQAYTIFVKLNGPYDRLTKEVWSSHKVTTQGCASVLVFFFETDFYFSVM